MNRPPRRYWHEHRGAAFWLVLVLLAIWRAYSPAAPAAPEQLEEGIHEVRRAVDGDTLLLNSGARVRLQGINTPETVKPDSPVEAWGPEASQFTRTLSRKPTTASGSLSAWNAKTATIASWRSFGTAM